MASDPPDEDPRIRIGEWATMTGFELLDDLDQEAERLPLFVIQTTIDRDVHNVRVGLWEDTTSRASIFAGAAAGTGSTRPVRRSPTPTDFLDS
jgi:hypothetical protein